MKKVMTFDYEEFENLVYEVTYRTMSIGYDEFDSVWYFVEVSGYTDELREEWLEEFGKDALEEVISFNGDDDRFVYAMIGKKFNAVVNEVIIDFCSGRVAVIFE